MSMQETHTLTLDNLFSATQVMPVVADKLSIAQSGEVKRGAIVDASGAVVKKTTADNVDTYSEPYAILAEDVDTTSAAVEAAVYLTGEFNASALSVASGVTVSDFKKSARKVGIFIK